MKINQIYSMTHLEDSTVIKNADLFLLAYDGEERAYYSWNYLLSKGFSYKNIIILAYNKENLKNDKNLIKLIKKNNKTKIYFIPNDQKSFMSYIKKIKIETMNPIIIDISGMMTMHIFLLLKYIKQYNNPIINIINTIPYDYIFNKEPFLSYHSYIGNLKLTEILGYSGIGKISQDNDLFIFMGFEGSLSLKVVEEITFKNLYLINTIPSYYQKYKDISIINNYNIINTYKNIILHTPADNPFEVYNLLDSKIDDNTIACIAPLSTKPISLGICLYALEHNNVRVVYPVSDIYNDNKSNDVYISYVYEINL